MADPKKIISKNPKKTVEGKDQLLKKSKEEIKDLFSQLKGSKKIKKTKEDGGDTKQIKASGNKDHQKKRVKKESFTYQGSILPEEDNNRRQTEEGYRIYSEKELKIGQGKETNLCPFDCNCCF